MTTTPIDSPMAILVPLLTPREWAAAATLDCDGDKEVDAVDEADVDGIEEVEVGDDVIEAEVEVDEGEVEDGVVVGGPTSMLGGNVDPPNVKSDPSGILGPKYPKGINEMLVSTTGAPFTCEVIGTGVSHGGKTWVGAAILAKNMNGFGFLELRVAQKVGVLL